MYVDILFVYVHSHLICESRIIGHTSNVIKTHLNLIKYSYIN